MSSSMIRIELAMDRALRDLRGDHLPGIYSPAAGRGPDQVGGSSTERAPGTTLAVNGVSPPGSPSS